MPWGALNTTVAVAPASLGKRFVSRSIACCDCAPGNPEVVSGATVEAKREGHDARGHDEPYRR